MYISITNKIVKQIKYKDSLKASCDVIQLLVDSSVWPQESEVLSMNRANLKYIKKCVTFYLLNHYHWPSSTQLMCGWGEHTHTALLWIDKLQAHVVAMM